MFDDPTTDPTSDTEFPNFDDLSEPPETIDEALRLRRFAEARNHEEAQFIPDDDYDMDSDTPCRRWSG